MRALLLSAYDAQSHRRWHQGMVRHLPYDWRVLTLPPRHFRWRFRGNPLSWFTELGGIVQEEQFDRLVVTSMVDLATLRGLVPQLTELPTLVYFHENQFAYPLQHGEFDAELAIHNVYTALAADRVAFNSEFNRTSFMEGVRWMLKKMPDCVPPSIVERLEEKGIVLPVGLEAHWFNTRCTRSDGPLRIVWNHRWEYDKAPERFFGALRRMRSQGVEFEVYVMGQRFSRSPAVFEEARHWLGTSVKQWGYVESVDRYRQILGSGDVVVSTALHDFQGLAIQEAMACGCIPLVPDRLAYPEYVREAWRFASCPSNGEQEAEALCERLVQLAQDPSGLSAPLSAHSVQRFQWSLLCDAYTDWIESAQNG